MNVDGERVWIETVDVADDLDTHFPTVGHEYEEQADTAEAVIGDAPCRLIPIQPFVFFAVCRLTTLLGGADGES